jgi:predicted nucleic acid-binding Zn ribbon protein
MEPECSESCPVCGRDNSESASGFCSDECEQRYVEEQRRRDEEYATDLLLEEYPPEVIEKIIGGC